MGDNAPDVEMDLTGMTNEQLIAQINNLNNRAARERERAAEATQRGQLAEAARLQAVADRDAANARTQRNGPSTAEWRDMVNAIIAPRPAAVFQNSINPVTHVLYDDNAPVPGSIDTKDVKLPPSFNGKQWDARPFIHRLEAVFALQPNKYRLSRTRILAACSIITNQPSATWAMTISKAVTEHDNSAGYHLDKWDEFVKYFIQGYGIANEKEHAQHRIQKLYQGDSPFESYVAEFRRLQILAVFPNDTAIIFFKRGINKRLYDAIYSLPVPPTDLNDWIKQGREKDRQYMEQRDFAKAHRAFTPGTHTYHAPAQKTFNHPFTRKDPDAMDVDQIRQKGRRPGKQVKPTSKSRSQARPQGRTQRVSNVEASTSSSRPNVICYNCGREGHYKRDCKITKINQLSQEERDVLAEYAFSLPRGSQEDEDDDNDDNDNNSVIQMPYAGDEEEEEPLLVHDEEDEQDFPQDSTL